MAASVNPHPSGFDALMQTLATATADGLLHPRPAPGAEVARLKFEFHYR